MKVTPAEAITTALTGMKEGFTTGELRDCVPKALKAKISGTVNRMLKAGALVKHKGESPRKARYTLNPDHVQVTTTPPPKGKRRMYEARALPPPPAPARPAGEPRLTPGPLALYYGEDMRCEHWNVNTMADLMRELKNGPRPTPFD